ncbi:MAG: exodeoxyribonuclease V subunit alpha [Pseudomonadota bacterium]
MTQIIDFNLDSIHEQGLFSSLDYFFAKSVSKTFNEKNAIVQVSVALASKALSQGHICLDLKEITGESANDNANRVDFFDIPVHVPTLKNWIFALTRSPLVSDTIQTPLVLDSDNRLYLSKYFDFQSRLIQNIVSRLPIKTRKGKTEKNQSEKKVEPCINKLIDTFFDSCDSNTIGQQKAVKHAVLKPLTIISGGPGTGKTYVSGLIKKILVSWALQNQMPEPRIISVAPTGKAASKMANGKTIHSVLRPLKNKPGFFYCKKNPLIVDIVIIDEASMIDIVLLTRLMEAIPITAKIIILGDTHQLSSIQAGSVFNDICSAKPLSSCVFFLDYNFRSKGKTGIEKLSKAINENDVYQIEQVLTGKEYTDIVFEDLSKKDFQSVVYSYIKEGYHSLSKAGTIEKILIGLDDFRILCAHNSGEYGTLSINHLCENILRSQQNFDIPQRLLKQIIMVTVNDYKKGLFNGDTGIVIRKDKECRAVFKDQDEKIKEYRIADLPGHVPAFAITIHKSQGSEFKTVLIIIPDHLSSVLTRQLLYTGITRAKTKVIITGRLDIIKQAVSLSINRTSGLTKGLEMAMAP